MNTPMTIAVAEPRTPRRGLAARLVALCAVAAPLAPHAAVADDVQGWYGVSVAGPVAPGAHLLLSFDTQARFREDATELDVLTAQGGVGWRLRSNVDLWLGASDIQLRRAGPDVAERRTWAGASVRLGTWLGGQWTSRTRLERRVRDPGDDTGWRLREQVRYSHPLAAHPALALVLWDELFYTFEDTDWGQRRGVEQNRAFLGASWLAAPHVRLEAGYLGQHVRRPGSAQDYTNNALSVTVAIAL
jgi:hypothetical protein